MSGLRLSHWNGTSFKVYNRFTKKAIGCIIDEIDWRFVDGRGTEYEMPAGYNRFSIDQAITYFTSKNFIKKTLS